MRLFESFLTRRSWLRGGLALGSAALFAPGVFAEQLARTPRLTEGPFYPDRLPLDTDNDLLIVNDAITPAVGEITHLTGRVLSAASEPVRGVVVEIWQVDNRGVYLHTADSGRRARDTNFQGFGRCAVNAAGEYRFRTIKPVPYPGRTPHIHVKIKKGNRELLTTQLFVNGHPQNNRDGVFLGIRDPLDRELVLVDFKPIKESRIGELSARFDIVLGVTPADTPDAARPRRGRSD
jgi:protocatechuate 3,4-dioxygenase beta subunit